MEARSPSIATITWDLATLASLITTGKNLSALNQEQQNGLQKAIEHHGISLLLHRDTKLPESLAAWLAHHKKMAAAGETLKRNALMRLIEWLNQQGLRNHVVFKGTAIAHTLYQEPWQRPRTDVDILIAPSEIDRYKSALINAGFESEFAIEGQYVSYQLSFAQVLAGELSLMIDLHWRINNRQCLAAAFSAHELLDDAQRLGGELEKIRVPSNVDSLLIACLHRLGHHNREERLAWLYDIHLLCNSLNQAEWQLLVDKTREKKLASLTLDALNTCMSLFDTKLDSYVESELQRQARRNEPSAIFMQRDLAEWRYFLNDLRALSSWKARFAWLKESCFPSPSYVKNKMGTDNLLKAYLLRFTRGVKRVMTR